MQRQTTANWLIPGVWPFIHSADTVPQVPSHVLGKGI